MTLKGVRLMNLEYGAWVTERQHGRRVINICFNYFILMPEPLLAHAVAIYGPFNPLLFECDGRGYGAGVTAELHVPLQCRVNLGGAR